MGKEGAKAGYTKAEVDALIAASVVLKSNLITFTKNLADAYQEVSYTGAGFEPKALILIGAVDGTKAVSVGYSCGSGKNGSVIMDAPTQDWYGLTSLLYLSAGGGAGQTCFLSSFDSDGFTLYWDRDGSPTGTAKCYALCIG